MTNVSTRIMTSLSTCEALALVHYLGGQDLHEEPVLQELLERLRQSQRYLQGGGTQCMTSLPTPHPTPPASLQMLPGLPPSFREARKFL